MAPSEPRRFTFARVACLAAVVGASAVFGCEVIVGIKDRALGTADGGPDTGFDAGPDAPVDTCNHAFPPPKPAADDPAGPGGADQTLQMAMFSVNFGAIVDGGNQTLLGYDLDNICSCPGPQTCKARVAGATHCDDTNGRDNAVALVLGYFSEQTQGIFTEDAYNIYIQNGSGTMLFRVRHYNGMPNDTQVELAIYLSDGATSPDGGNQGTPSWSGSDSWTIDRGSIFTGDPDGGGPGAIPSYVTVSAYVSGGVLVGAVDFPFTLRAQPPLGNFVIPLTGTIVTANLNATNGVFRMDNGIVAGRYATSSLLNTLSTFPNPGGGGFICPGTQSYENVKGTFCGYADIHRDPTTNDSNTYCDALSAAFGFTAVPAVFGPAFTQGAATKNCADAGADDCDTPVN